MHVCMHFSGIEAFNVGAWNEWNKIIFWSKINNYDDFRQVYKATGCKTLSSISCADFQLYSDAQDDNRLYHEIEMLV